MQISEAAKLVLGSNEDFCMRCSENHCVGCAIWDFLIWIAVKSKDISIIVSLEEEVKRMIDEEEIEQDSEFVSIYNQSLKVARGDILNS